VSPPAPDPKYACFDGIDVLGPVTFHRHPGGPVVETATFETPGDGHVCVFIQNGAGDRSTRASMATLAIDGNQVASPHHFNPHVAELRKTSDVSAGTHELAVEVISSPSAQVTVTVKYAPYPVLDHNPVSSGCGRLKVDGLHATPDPFLPPETTATLRANMHVLQMPGFPGLQHYYRLDYAFQVISGDTCEPVAFLPGSLPLINPNTVLVSASWDGTDAFGATVPDGQYYYRVVGYLVRVHQTLGVEYIFDTVTSSFQALLKDTPVEVTESWTLANTVFSPFGWVTPAETGRTLLASAGPTTHAVAPDGTITHLFDEGPDRRVIGGGSGDHFGVYEPGAFSVYGADGAMVSSFASTGYAYFKFLPTAGLLLGFHSSLCGPGDCRVDRIDLMTHAGLVQGMVPVSGLRISRVSADGSRFFLASVTEIRALTATGLEVYQVPFAPRDYEVSQNGSRLIGISLQARDTVAHYDEAIELGTDDLGGVVWDVAVSPSGIYSAATTKTSVHVFQDGVLQSSVDLPFRFTVTLDVSDQGHVLVGGQDGDFLGKVLLLSEHGTVLGEVAGPVDDNGWRPWGQFVFDSETFFVKHKEGLGLYAITTVP
jgi:hypothetical protein